MQSGSKRGGKGQHSPGRHTGEGTSDWTFQKFTRQCTSATSINYDNNNIAILNLDTMRYRVTVTSKTAFAIAVRQWRTQDFILEGILIYIKFCRSQLTISVK